MPRKAKAPKTEETNAAPEQKVSKRRAVLTYLRTNRKATAAEVAAALKEQGIDISETYVSNIKSTAKKRRKKRAPKEQPEAAPAEKKVAPDLTTAAELIAKLGGLQQAKKTIDKLEHIKKML